VQQPWPGFRLDVERAVYGHDGSSGVFVSRAERRRARGKAHDATIKQIREMDGEEIIFERKPIEKLTEKDLALVPIPEPYGRAADPKKLRDDMVESLRAWIAAGKPKDKPPRSPKGDAIRKVRVATKDNVAVKINGGTADRGDMARVDVFRKKNTKGKWEFYVIPIYPHQIATMEEPPNQAVVAYKSESEWPVMDGSYEFMWTLNPMNYTELIKSNGEVIEGYFRGLDRATGAIGVSPHNDNNSVTKGIGARTLSSFKKFSVDRLGRRFEVKREQRTWRGKTLPATTPEDSTSVAYRVSNSDGVERPASDAAE
jgi:CRISPR-associated endonuclease Csn1